MNLPIIIINFKTYDTATGIKALKLAKICDKVAKETGASIAVAVQAADIYKIAKSVSIPVFAQHIDPVTYGSFTGSTMPETVREAGAVGTLLNHSERQISNEILEKSIKRAKEAGLVICVCADTEVKAAEVAKFAPDMIAVEPPELIGGDISVSTAKPEVVLNAVENVHRVAPITVLCGAGVKNGKDIKKSIELGAKGVLLASGITKVKQPKRVLLDMVSGLK